MQYKTLGTTDLNASVLCLGTMTFGNQNTEAEAHAQLDYALSQGINFIDTAEMYPIPPNAERQGKTETIIGNWLSARGKRSKIILASKVAGPGMAVTTRPMPVRLDRANILAAIDSSLERLQTDYLDLYQVHWPQRTTNYFGRRGFSGAAVADEVTLEETLSALGEVVQSGKVRYVGVSNETPWGVSEYLRLAREKNLPHIATIQNQYSLLNRTFEIGLSELCQRESISLLAYSTLDSGALTGKYLGGTLPAGSRFALPDYQPANLARYNSPWAQEAIAAYVAIATKHGLDPAQMAIAFAASRSFMGSVIIGATTMEQLTTDIAAASITLSEAVLADIAKLYTEKPDPHA